MGRDCWERVWESERKWEKVRERERMKRVMKRKESDTKNARAVRITIVTVKYGDKIWHTENRKQVRVWCNNDQASGYVCRKRVPLRWRGL